MKYVLAVSGGVDSVVLLDMFARRYDAEQLVVAHFEHGIRAEASKQDALFVEKLSQGYGLICEVEHGDLPQHASEELAREKRYAFLKRVAAKHGGHVITAHHQGDLIETIAINLRRGTGWRGLAVFGNSSVFRPLLGLTKADIYEYALKHELEWVEDETNQSKAYLRNRLRHTLRSLLSHEAKQKIVELFTAQTALVGEITNEVDRLMPQCEGSRYYVIMLPDNVAMELLRSLSGAKLTRPQLMRMLLAVKTFAPGSVYEAGSGVRVSFTKQHFIVTNSSKMV